MLLSLGKSAQRTSPFQRQLQLLYGRKKCLSREIACSISSETPQISVPDNSIQQTDTFPPA